ncbi:hypothetical protein AVEN_136655-1 [Araneus ventricosus]|uniref:Uncharacterized protein n=1 Tax=Araneus ventricosus TaxID=182803 RepID=A0A4Y2CA95_ARAVE|nr:hypothetical protein AVEN_136655-1 [Araneus ventricosus]
MWPSNLICKFVSNFCVNRLRKRCSNWKFGFPYLTLSYCVITPASDSASSALLLKARPLELMQQECCFERDLVGFEPWEDDENYASAGTPYPNFHFTPVSELLTLDIRFNGHQEGSEGLVVRSLLRGRRILGSKPDSTKDPPCGPSMRYLSRRPNVLTLVWSGSLETRVPAHVSSSSSRHCSQLRGPSQNSPHVASKRDLNKTKQN